jgi:hypothetical protein
MALSKKTINKHNIKRAEVFAANGLGDHDVAFAHPEFTGYASKDEDCTLCGHRHIKWLFSIRFDAPDALTALGKVSTGLVRTDVVNLTPVGSKCITDWLEAVPESAEKLEALKRWHFEIAKANKAKSKMALKNKLASYGYSDLSDLSAAIYATLTKLYKAKMSVSWKLRKQLKNYARKAKYSSIRSASTVKKAEEARLIVEALVADKVAKDAAEAAETPEIVVTVDVTKTGSAGASHEAVHTPEPKAEPKSDLDHLPADERKAVEKGREVYAQGGFSGVREDEANALIDIANKVKKYGKWASTRQRGYYEYLLGKAIDALASQKKAPAPASDTSPVAKPESATFVSASGIAGARY